MKEKYDEAVFDFFTSDEDRFLMMRKIAQHEPKVRETLVHSFWKKLEQELRKRYYAKNEDWIVRFSDKWSVGDNKLMVYREEWDYFKDSLPLVAVAFEWLYLGRYPFLGIITDREKHMEEGFDIGKIHEDLKTSIKNNPAVVGEKNPWWPISRHTSVNLSSHEQLVGILPGENESNTISNLIMNVEEYTSALDEFMSNNDNLKGYQSKPT